MAGVEDSSLLFNIVFFVTLLSLVVQGTTVSLMAEWLGLAYPERERIFNDEVMNRMLDDATTELTVTEAMLESGHHLRDIVLPAATLVVMVARDGTFFVPKGNSVLRVGDKLLVVSAIDNLLKGASGQAVQNMNLLFGLDEREGLRLKASAF